MHLLQTIKLPFFCYFLSLLLPSKSLSAQVWDGVAGGLNGGVHAFELYNGKIVMGGSFKNGPSGPQGTKTGHIIEFDSTVYSSTINNYFGVVIRGLHDWNGDLVAVGDYWNPNTNSQPCVGCNGVARWDGAVWNPLGDGANNDVLCVTEFEGNLVVGGDFLEMDNNDSMQCIAHWDTAWHYYDAYVSPNTVFDNDIRAMAVYNNDLYVGGDFNNASGYGSADGIAIWTPNDTAFKGVVQPGGVDSTVRALYVDGTDLYIGGHFLDILGDANMSGICRYDGSNFYPLGTGLNGYVRAIIKYHGEIYAGGQFTIAGGVAALNIARWDGTQWRACGGGVDSGYVRAFEVYKEQLYVGGSFKKYDGTNGSSPYVARWTTPKPVYTGIPVGDLVINEFMADNDNTMNDQDGEDDDWIELFNNSNDTIPLQGVVLADNFGGSSSFVFPDTLLPPGGYIIVWADDQIQAGLHAPFKLGAGGEQVVLWDNSGNLIDSITFGVQIVDVSTGRYLNGTGPFVLMPPTFEAQNTYATPVNPGDLVINEFMAENQSNMADQDGEFDDWLELYNTTSSPINLAGFRISDTIPDNSMWVFPDTFIAANGYLIIWLDNQENQVGLHANFKLGGAGEELGLWDMFGNQLDTITFGAQSNDITTGRYPNGTGPFMALPPTFGAQNLTTLVNPGDLVINEFMAVNGMTMADQDGEFDDWIELYNTTSNAIDLNNFTLSDDLGNSSMWTFPDTFIAANGYLIIWADNQVAQAGLHASFGLGGGGEEIGLWDNFGQLIDSITFGVQSLDISTGRFPNGTGPFMELIPTFHAENTNAGAIINYNQASYCSNETDPIPTISGIQGGIFSATPSGLSINTGTGEIDLSTSMTGISFVISYSYTGGTAMDTVVVLGQDDASFNYAITTGCQNGNDLSATLTGLSGGVFSSTVGLDLDTTSGLIHVMTSSPGIYDVNYSSNGPCPNSSLISVTIAAPDDASFAYNSGIVCQSDTTVPMITGLFGGGFTATPAGLSINASTGLVDASNSVIGNYNIDYTTNGTCPNTSSFSLAVTAMDDASYSYNSTTSCQNGSDLTATINGLSGGVFTSQNGLALNMNSGLVDVSNSASGNYNVSYTTNGTCPNTSLISIQILATDDASFSYGGTTFCQSANDPLATPVLAGGTYSSSSGLAINSSTGVIDLSASSVGTYWVTYLTNGNCPDSSVQSISITTMGNASFSYSSSSYCSDETNPIASISGNPGGVFSSTGGLIINSGTGEIDLAGSTAGTYLITYSVGGACPSSANFSVTIVPVDVASFAFTDTTICLNIGTNPILSVVGGATGGNYSSNSGGLVFVDSLTGEINLSASANGTYLFSYTSNGNCPTTTTTTVNLSICGKVNDLKTTNEIKLYPNPNNGIFILEQIGKGRDLTLQILDVYGRVIYLSNFYLSEGEQQQIELGKLVSGMYLVKIQDGETTQSIKIILKE